MQIQPINNNNVSKAYNTQFKSVYPVVHWVAESNASYAPALTETFTRTLNGKLVRELNLSKKEINLRLQKIQQQIGVLTKEIDAGANKKFTQKALKKIEELKKKHNQLAFVEKIQDFICQNDKDYATCPYVRTFYNRDGGYRKNSFEPFAYLMTGKDAKYFEETYAKPIGCVSDGNMRFSAELQQVKNDYWRQGFNYIKSKIRQSKDINGLTRELHVKLHTNRSNSGKIQGYNIMGMGFYPSEGPNNPFVITGLIKSGGL